MADFKTIHTNHGLARLSSAEASGSRINLPTIAVGDGNGKAVDPTASQTQLVRERYRSAVNRVYQDPTNPLKFSAELVIPASVGGFTLREVGVFDDTGSLFVVGNLPETYKPASSEGAFSDTVIRIDFIVNNAGSIELIADPNVVIVTRNWVMNNVTAKMIIPGGTTGQVLTKKSNTDGDTEWRNPDVTSVVVDVIEEPQTLADGQTRVKWNVVTTRGLAVYIAGDRISKGTGANEWKEDPADPVQSILLGKSYAAGTRILGTQNEPTGSAPFPLVRNENLNDVPDKEKGRVNLGVYSRAETDRIVPPGSIIYMPRSVAPPGYLKANGAAVSRTAYSVLFATIGTMFGAGDGFTTFNLPDLRGEHIRGWDDGRGIDPGRGLGSFQEGQLLAHNHAGSLSNSGEHGHVANTGAVGDHTHGMSMGMAGDHYHPNGDYGSGSGTNDPRVHMTRVAGGHGHSAWTDQQGQHTHANSFGQYTPGSIDLAAPSFDEPRNAVEWGQPSVKNVTSSPAGLHAHNVGITPTGEHQHLVVIGAAGNHNHTLGMAGAGAHAHPVNVQVNGLHSHVLNINSTGGGENRVRNIALLACIKY